MEALYGQYWTALLLFTPVHDLPHLQHPKVNVCNSINGYANLVVPLEQRLEEQCQKILMEARLPGPCRAESGSDEETEVPLWQRSRAPLFEAFWQGRLIPGARIESLPFIEASS